MGFCEVPAIFSSAATFSRFAKYGEDNWRMRLKLDCRLLVRRAVMLRDQPRLALMPRPEPVSVNPNRFGEMLLLP